MALRSDLQATRILLQSALFPLLLAGSIYSPGDWVGRCLESKPFHFLGKISYSVYLWQMPFLTPPANMQSAALWFPVKLVAVILVAYGSYVIIEKPCMDLGRRLSRA
jgi:peptidoglycan/LPS O-acetylase OafA/YrhL